MNGRECLDSAEHFHKIVMLNNVSDTANFRPILTCLNGVTLSGMNFRWKFFCQFWVFVVNEKFEFLKSRQFIAATLHSFSNPRLGKRAFSVIPNQQKRNSIPDECKCDARVDGEIHLNAEWMAGNSDKNFHRQFMMFDITRVGVRQHGIPTTIKPISI